MTRARPEKSTGTTISALLARVRALENSGRDVLTPVRLSDAYAVTTTKTAAFVALVNGTGAQVTWWVKVDVSGAVISLQLRDTAGIVGPIATSGVDDVVAVSLPVAQDWGIGEQRLVYLDAWVNAGSATALPVRALVA